MNRQLENLKLERPDAVPIFELPNIEAWFETICEKQGIADPVAVFSQIETWMDQDILLSDVQPSYKHTVALKTFLSRVMQAAKQAQTDPYDTENPSLYYRLERTPTFQKLFKLYPLCARAILIFACIRPKASNRIEERLEVETGRFAVHNFKREPDNYFFRQGCADFEDKVRRSNGILKNGTEQQPTNHQHELIQRRTLKQIGKLLIALEAINYEEAKDKFENRLPNDLTLQTYATCAAQLETFCPQTFKQCQSIISQALATEKNAVNGLYFLGTVMRVLYEAIRVSGATGELSEDGEDVALQSRLNDTLVRQRLESDHTPRTKRVENQQMWKKIKALKDQGNGLEAIFHQLNDKEKNMITEEKLRALGRSCGLNPAEERLI
jgi:hypothetical protein